jgi:DNA segregation ATPase FtsK/SpoIIIE-like protein
LKTYEMVELGTYANGTPKYIRQCTGSDNSLSENLAMLLQKGRSSGFRIVCAAQRPSTEIIPGDAKANFPVRVAFRLPKAVDSEVVLDEGGAEGLTDKGDGLIISPEYRETIRFQSYFKEKEVHA